MGCCVSKKTDFAGEEEELKYVQDKLVISHYPKKVSPIPFPNKENPVPITCKVIQIPAPDKTSPSPPSPLKSTSFSSTLTSTTSNNTVSSWSSSVSSLSSNLSSKDRSFSNEFLQACYRENPHISRINSIREASLSLAAVKPPSPQRYCSPARPIMSPLLPNQSVSNPQRVSNGSTQDKKVQSSSPRFSTTLKRQKSFRKEQERVLAPSCSLPGGKSMRSPSPSRRFGKSGSKVNPIDTVSLSLRQESRRQENRETQIHRISSKIDENVVKEVVSGQNESAPVEDIDNPLISLDCFIFL